MTELKRRGDLAELAVAADLRRRGYVVSFPFGETAAYDLVVDRGGRLERVQVKHACSDGAALVVRCRRQTVVAGRVRSVRRYTSVDVDWLAVFDATTNRCYYVPAAELGDGRAELTLRLTPARNGQRSRVRDAEAYADL